jgi:phosphatidylinositol-3-phosphatase
MHTRSRTLVLLAVPALLAVSTMSGQAQARPGVTRGVPAVAVQHVVWIWEENHSYSDIIGSASAPYFNSLAKTYGSATNAWSLSHPSAPNYIGATSGLPHSQLPNSDCTNCKKPGPDLFTQGESWRAYEESMTVPCSMSATSGGLYVPRHNPPTYFLDIPAATCKADDLPFTALAADIAHNTLPAFAMITPNLTDDMHTGSIAQANTWLAAHLPALLGSSAFTSGSMVIFIMWDEGSGGGGLKGIDCTISTSQTCHVPLLVLSTHTHGATVSSKLTHYSVLRATEELLGLPKLGQAASAPDLLTGFGL